MHVLHMHSLEKAVGSSYSNAIYIKAIQKFGKISKKLIKGFEKCESRLRPHILQDCIRDMSRDSEAYIQLRNRFTRTLAVYTTCGYILGIGDRHLDNFLVDQSTGQVVGIDFGAAFGYALNLPVPELMPLRYTRQFQHLMDPLSTYDHFKNHMMHTLRALQDSKETLLNVMDVFVKEPSVDWVEMASRVFEKSNASMLQKQSSSSLQLENNVSSLNLGDNTQEIAALNPDIAWYPKHKLTLP